MKKMFYGCRNFMFLQIAVPGILPRGVQGLNKEELKYARNEIYAGHGRCFFDQELQSYFNSKSWYQGMNAPENFQESTFTEIERANIELILEYETL